MVFQIIRKEWITGFIQKSTEIVSPAKGNVLTIQIVLPLNVETTIVVGGKMEHAIQDQS